MSKIGGIVLGILLLIALGCSNEVEMPSPYHMNYLAQPTDVEAVLDGKVVRVSWQIASTDHVAGFVVSFTDTIGSMKTRFVPGPAARSYADSSLSVARGSVYLVHVRAVDERNFLGPRSEVDSVSVP